MPRDANPGLGARRHPGLGARRHPGLGARRHPGLGARRHPGLGAQCHLSLGAGDAKLAHMFSAAFRDSLSLAPLGSLALLLRR
jgi:hypothetical protein